MLNRPTILLSYLMVYVSVAGCGDSPSGPQGGSISVQATTTGKRPDPDGFLVSIDGNPVGTVPANGNARFQALAVGPHTLTVSGAMWNCTLATATLSIVVRAGSATSVSLTAHCPRILSNELVFATEAYGFAELAAMRADGTARDRITIDQLVNTMPAASPDGRSIAFTSLRDGSATLYVMDADVTSIRKVGRSKFDGNAAWSPDGMRIAFRSQLPGPYGDYGRIWIVNADGTGLRQLSPETVDYTYDHQPSWSPDGTKIVFARNADLFVINADGTGLVNLKDCPLVCDDPEWSPDGRRIAFAMGWDVYTMNVGGDGLVQLTADAAQEEEPTWSPDGSEIVFSRVVDNRFQLFRVSASGGPSVRLSAPQGSDFAASWVPAQQTP